MLHSFRIVLFHQYSLRSLFLFFREHLDAAKNEADATEARAKEVNASLSTLEGEMKKVKVQYLQIADDAKNAFQLVDKALQAAETAEQGNKQMMVGRIVSYCLSLVYLHLLILDGHRSSSRTSFRSNTGQRSASEES